MSALMFHELPACRTPWVTGDGRVSGFFFGIRGGLWSFDVFSLLLAVVDSTTLVTAFALPANSPAFRLSVIINAWLTGADPFPLVRRTYEGTQ